MISEKGKVLQCLLALSGIEDDDYLLWLYVIASYSPAGYLFILYLLFVYLLVYLFIFLLI